MIANCVLLAFTSVCYVIMLVSVYVLQVELVGDSHEV